MASFPCQDTTSGGGQPQLDAGFDPIGVNLDGASLEDFLATGIDEDPPALAAAPASRSSGWLPGRCFRVRLLSMSPVDGPLKRTRNKIRQGDAPDARGDKRLGQLGLSGRNAKA